MTFFAAMPALSSAVGGSVGSGATAATSSAVSSAGTSSAASSSGSVLTNLIGSALKGGDGDDSSPSRTYEDPTNPNTIETALQSIVSNKLDYSSNTNDVAKALLAKQTLDVEDKLRKAENTATPMHDMLSNMAKTALDRDIAMRNTPY